MALPMLELLLWESTVEDHADRGMRSDRPRYGPRPVDAPVELAVPSPPSSLPDVSDTDVVAAIRNGDAAMFERLYVAYLDPLFDFAMAYLRDAAKAEEAVAAVLGNLWMRRATWVVRDRIEPYLFGAVHREVLTMQRTAKRRADLLARADADTLAQTHGASPQVPDAGSEQHDLEARVWAAVAALPTRYRVATVLRWQRAMSYDDIAEVMEITPQAARQVVSRAVRMLRSALGV